MKRKFAIICICVFSAAGISAGIISNTDSAADVKETETIKAADVKTAEGIEKSSTETYIGKDNVENRKTQSVVKVENNESATEDSVSSNKKKFTSVKAETNQTVHNHNWEQVYDTRKVRKVKHIPYTKCYACNEDMTGNPNHIDEHLLNGESNVHYGTEYKEEVYYESEKYVSGSRCSCGAVK